MLVRVADDSRERCAAGDQGGGILLRDAGPELRHIGLVPLRRQFSRAGTAAVQKGLEFRKVDGFSRGQSFDGDTDGVSVGLAEHGQL